MELTVMVLLVALLAGGAMFYLQQTAADSRLGIAQEELTRIRDEYHRWTLVPGHKAPKQISDLKRLSDAGDQDPWGQPYLLQPERKRILSSGPDGILQTSGEDLAPLGDDLCESLVAFSSRPTTPIATSPVLVAVKMQPESLPGQPVTIVVAAYSATSPITAVEFDGTAVSFSPERKDDAQRVTATLTRTYCDPTTYRPRARARNATGDESEGEGMVIVRCYAKPFIDLTIIGPDTVQSLEEVKYTMVVRSRCHWLARLHFNDGQGHDSDAHLAGTEFKHTTTVMLEYRNTKGDGLPEFYELKASAFDGCGTEAITTRIVKVLPPAPVH